MAITLVLFLMKRMRDRQVLNKKIKILFYSHEIDFAGTWRSHERIMVNLPKDIFDVYTMYWDECKTNNRLDIVRQLIGEEKVLSFKRSTTKNKQYYTPDTTNFDDIVLRNNFDIIHFARSGYPEWPFNKRLAKLQVETNIFAEHDTTPFCDKSFAISKYIYDLHKDCDDILWNPCDLPEPTGATLRNLLGIPSDAIVCGRIGRPTNFTPIALNSFCKLCEKHNMYMIIIGPSPEVSTYQTNGRIKCIAPTNDDQLIKSFYRSLDIFTHYRADGETQGTAIADAMMYSLPVISHTSNQFNGQIDTIQDGGRVVSSEAEYTAYLDFLVKHKDERMRVGQLGYNRAYNTFRTELSVKKAIDRYLEWLK